MSESHIEICIDWPCFYFWQKQVLSNLPLKIIIHCAVLFRAKSSVQTVQKRVVGQKERKKGQGFILILNSFYIWLFGIIIRLPTENMPTNGLGTSCLLFLSVYHELDQP